MTDNLFDSFIREKLQNYSSAVPPDMWERIMQKKEKRRTFFWWKSFAIIGAVLLTGLAGWVVMQGSTKSTGITRNATVPEKRSQLTSAARESVPEAKAPAGISILKEGDANSGNNHIVSKLSTSSSGSNTSDATPAAIKDPNTSVANRNTTIDLPITRSNATKSTTGFSQKKGNKVSGRKTDAFITEASDKIENALVANEEQSRFISPYPSLLLAEKEHRNFNDINITNLKPSFTSVDCPGTVDRSHGFFVEAFVSPDYSIRKLDAPLTEVDYLRRKDSMETRLASFTVGLRLSKNLGQNLVFKTGVQYSQINEKFSFRAEDERRLTTIVTIRTITRPDGSTTTIRDTSIIEQIGYRVRKSYNKYKSVDVPLLLGCEFGGDKWRGGFNLGAIINLSSWQQGETVDTSYNTLPFTKESQTLFKKHVGLGLYGSVNVVRNISPSFDVFAEPYFRYNFSRLTTSSSPFNQKFHVAGLLLGIRYNLTGSDR